MIKPCLYDNLTIKTNIDTTTANEVEQRNFKAHKMQVDVLHQVKGATKQKKVKQAKRSALHRNFYKIYIYIFSFQPFLDICHNNEH